MLRDRALDERWNVRARVPDLPQAIRRLQALHEPRDPVRQDFEENYWKALEQQLQATMRGIDRMDQVLTKLRRDCS